MQSRPSCVAHLAILLLLVSVKWASGDRECREIVERNVPNAIVRKSVPFCLKGCKSGTRVTILCKEFYYFENGDYTNGQILTCRHGKWRNQHDMEEKPAKCMPGCEALTADEMINATYVMGPPKKTYKNGNKLYWPAGSVVRTKCKPGFAFDYPPWRPIGNDDYKCVGGSIGWQRKIGSLVPMGGVDGRPGLCTALCNALDPLSDFAPGTRAVTEPGKDDTVVIRGKNYVYNRFLYVFECEPGLNFAKSGPHYEAGQQQLVCRGGSQGYYDVQTQQFNARPVECAKPGCASILRRLDKNATVTKAAKKCRSLNSNSIPAGCQLTVKCSPFHFFEKSDYGNGQVLTCTQNGWRDQNNEPYNVNQPAKCRWGCRELRDDYEMSNATYEGDGPPTNENLIFHNGDQKYWVNGVKVTTRCKKGFVRRNPEERNEPYSFVCRGGSDGWLNLATGQTDAQPGGCVPVCDEINNTPEGTLIKKQPKLKVSFDGVEHIMPGAIYTFQCAAGYEYPASTPYDKDKQQEVYCFGGSSGYRDISTGDFNAKPYPCQKASAKGCDPIVTSNSDVALDESLCHLKDGKMPKGCIVEIRCKQNYYPQNAEESGHGSGVQKLRCAAGNEGWVDEANGKRNATAITCLPGCQMISANDMKNAAFVTKIHSSNIVDVDGHQLVKRGTNVTLKCTNGHVLETQQEREKGAVQFMCVGGDDKWTNIVTGKKRVEPIQCLSTCVALPDPPQGTIFASYPDLFYHNGNMRVIEKGKYEFKCAKGYQYASNSPQSHSGRQTMICHGKGDLNGYYDPSTQNYDAKVEACVRGETPGCTKISMQSPPPHTKVLEMKDCSQANGKTAIGCMVTLACEDGYVTRQDSYTASGLQELVCADDGIQSSWRDRRSNSVAEFIQCQPGCQVVPMPNSVVLRDAQIWISNGAKQFYQPGAIMTIKCSPGTVTTSATVEEASRAREFQCKGGNEGWLEMATGASERWPGESCKSTCSPIDREEGFSFRQQPASFEIDGMMKVLEGGKYVIVCKEGYYYADSAHAAENKQILVCGSNGRYLDKSNAELMSEQAQVNEAEKCVKKVGPGCRDLVQQNALISERTCDGANIDGCSLTLKCKPGFIPGSQAYLASGMQQLKCMNGYDWVDQHGATVTEAFQCVPACLQPPLNSRELSVERNSNKAITVNNFVYVLPGGTVEVTCKNGYVWTATSNKHRVQTVECVGGEGNWKNNDAENIDIMEEACTGICPLLKTPIPANTVLVKNATFFEYQGETYALGRTAFVFECKPGYVYMQESAHYEARKQTIMCNPDTKKFEDVEARSTIVRPEGCVRPPNANECKEIVQNSLSTQVSVQKCNKDGDFYPTGCMITVQCRPGFYPEETYLKVVTQQLRCGPSGSGWTDQFNTVITKPLRCTKGCLPRTRFSNSSINTDTVITTQNTVYVLPDGSTAKCYSKESVVDVRRDISISMENYHSFYCADNTSTSGNSSKSISYDDSCINSCTAIRNLPKGVEIFKKPYEFQHSGKMFAFMSKPYVFKCKAGFAYRAGTIWAQKGRQALQCSDTTHTYSDLDTGAVDAQLESCEELKGCHMINQREDMTVVLEGCVTSGEVYTAGCRVKIMCPTTPQQYPSNANYLKEGYQQLTCRGDGSGWVDQFGISIRTAMSCTIGCIPRPTPNFANRSSNAWNLSVRINGVQLTCVAGSSSATVEKVVEEADDHDFYCKPSSQSRSHNDQMTLEDTCTNACFAIEEIPDSVTVEQKPWRLFDFKGKANFIVPFNGIYVFKCKYPNTYFMNAGQATTQRRLQCDGATSTYKDMATGEMNVKLTPCTEINGAVNLQTTNEHRLPTRTPPLIADNLQTVNHYTILPLTPPSMVNDNMYVGGSWIWQAAARREGNAFIRCSLPELNDDDTMTVFRDERCVNSKTEMVGCSIRIDCEQGYKLRGTSNTSTATVQIKCQPNGTWLDEGSNTTINNVNDLGCVPGDAAGF